ncbi:hypothetical protein FBR05_00325 [Deltaproteobacteria bacterium PRO3]|nr:hypothetical protein [Deltaproteobacteria bacterium PRO3]
MEVLEQQRGGAAQMSEWADIYNNFICNGCGEVFPIWERYFCLECGDVCRRCYMEGH